MVRVDFHKIVHDSYCCRPKYKEIIPGLPENYASIRTIEDLLLINYKHLSVEQQLRNSLIAKIKNNEFPYKGIIGYDEEVIPSINRSILSGHDMLLIGQIGQAKTKLAETIAHSLLTPIPIVRGTITNDVPTLIPESELVALLNDQEIVHFRPEFTVSSECETIIRNNRLDTKVDWVDGRSRFKYLLATPDISVKDLVGQIDAIKLAKKGVEYYSVESYSPGQLLQARHGILCIDELPVLDPRKQVALLSVLQEGKFTTGSYSVIFRPDVKIIATSNPVDYTHSGKIIEPLYDRLRSHITTHYPKLPIYEMLMMIQEARVFEPFNLFIPVFILQCIAEISRIARSHSEINQDKGVSVRMSIHSLEILISEAARTRSIPYGTKIVPRFSDLHCLLQTAKFVLAEIDDTIENRNRILASIVSEATKEVSTFYLSEIPFEKLEGLRREFKDGRAFVTSQDALGSKIGNVAYESEDYESQVDRFLVLKYIVEKVSKKVIIEQERFEESAIGNGIDVTFVSVQKKIDSEFLASIIELVLEGLRFIDPPLIERKNGSYVSSKI